MLTQYSSSSQTPFRTYTIGAPGVTGVDYNFTSVANMTEQSIQLGLTTIIPANSQVTGEVIRCTAALVGGTATVDVGISSGSDEYESAVDLSALNSVTSSSGVLDAVGTASSIYVSATPSANWNTLSAWKLKINIYNNLSV